MPLQKGPVESQLSVPVIKFSVTNNTEKYADNTAPGKSSKSNSKKRKFEGTIDDQPKRPLTPFFRFMRDQQKNIRGDSLDTMTNFSKMAAAQWNNLPASKKAKYDAEYEIERCKYHSALSCFVSGKQPSEKIQNVGAERDNLTESTSPKRQEGQSQVNLFNKIVKLKKQGLYYADPQFEYYYVLTYIPDLYWCHLAPLRTVGVFGPNKPLAEGKPIWMLVSEEEGKEIDISAQYCEVVKARAMKGGIDADKEQWDIREAESVISSEKKSQMSDNSDNFSKNLMDTTDRHVNGQRGNKFTNETKVLSSDVNLSGLSSVLARRSAMKAQHLLR